MLTFAFSLFVIGLEIFMLIKGKSFEFPGDTFVIITGIFWISFCILEYIFRLFVNGFSATFFSFIPVTFFYFLVRNLIDFPYMAAAIIAAAFLRVLLLLIPHREIVTVYGSYVLDLAFLYLYFGLHGFGRWLFIDRILVLFLVLLTLSSLRKNFPFYFFILLGILVFFIPVKDEPIDWSPVVRFGERIVQKASDVSYYLSMTFGESNYTTGYSSFNASGKKVEKVEKIQLTLKMAGQPYYSYVDDESGKRMKVRKVLYLAGGKGSDKASFVQFLEFLHDEEIEPEIAELFSHIYNADMSYEFMNTRDEIAPVGTFLLKTGDKEIESGVNETIHRKGYELSARYLAIDYGSPYFISLIDNNVSSSDDDDDEHMTYQEICDYAKKLYGIEFFAVADEKEYEDIVAVIKSGQQEAEYTDVSGTSDRMMELARRISDGAVSDYDKCRFIEAYLRQYKYSTDAVGGYNEDSDMSTPSGMADIADRFLFDTGEGYCVHYTSAMVMLLRLSGIPARAVYGFRYDFPFEKEDTYEISSNLAHTWPEAYIPNVGWISFEPTSRYPGYADYTWHKKAKEITPVEDVLPENAINIIPVEVEPVEPIEDAAQMAEMEELKRKENIIHIIIISLIVTLSVMLLIAVLIGGNLIIWHLRYKYGTPEKKLSMDVERIKKRLTELSGEKIADRGLLSDFVKLAPAEFQDEVKSVFAVYYRALYANGINKTPSAEENEMARLLLRKMK